VSSEVVISPIRNISAATEAQSLINIVDNAKRTGVYYRYSGTSQTVAYYDNNVTSSGTTTFTNNAYYLPTVNNVGFIVWTRQNNLSNAIIGSFSNGNGSLDSILESANETLGTQEVINYYGKYYAYNGSTITTATGNTYVNGRIYRLLIKDGAFYFASVDDPEFDLVDDTFEVVTNITDLQTLTLNGSQANVGKIYYYTGATDRTYETKKFYIMSYNTVTGTYYLKRFGAIDSNITNTAFRLSNKRLYVGNNYGGTGGTEEVIISATVYVNGKEYVRKFLVTVIG
jgi:hypothetical protein